MRVVLWCKLFLIFKLRERTVFEQKFAFSLVVFCSHSAFLLRFFFVNFDSF